MTTYADVKRQIAQLEKKAADLRKVEVAKAVANIREQMTQYELTVEDIAPVKSSAKGKAPTRSPKVKVGKPAKYMDPKTGKTWTGHGKAPAWIAVATKNGRRDDFLIEKVTQPKGAKPAESTAPKAPVAASKSTGITKKVAPKKPKAVAKKAPVAKKAAPAAKKSAPATKAKAVAPVKKAAKKAPAKVVAKPKAKAKAAIKSAGGTKPANKVVSKPSATQPQSAETTPTAS
jgi:DNA-binding protein H-NS